MAAAVLAPPVPLSSPSEPLPLSTRTHCFDVQFHPSEPLLAAATISGAVELHGFDTSAGTSELRQAIKCHRKSCRTARFLPSAPEAPGGGGSSGSTSSGVPTRLASAAADCLAAVSDLERGKRVWRGRLRAAGNALLPLGPERFVVGDDEGGIAVFDTRQKKAALRYAENSDFISDFALGTDGRSLCATSGDGTLAVYDLRKAGEAGLLAMSDFQEDEFLSVAILKQGTKVVCGSQTGTLAIFAWGHFGDQKDRVRGHPMSVDALVKISEDGILTGSSDGKVRAVSIYGKTLGNSTLGVVAEHGDLPVERLSVSPCGGYFASASHGQPAVRLWSMEAAHRLLAGEGPGGSGDAATAAEAAAEDADSSDEEPRGKKLKQRKKRRKASAGNEAAKKASNFFGDL